MKKIKYRNNNNNYANQVYSINYKFDSISPAGKCSGTALDLIKRYNELAKEAHSNGNYVEAEVFRQYAEHYRKIITEINERKNARFNGKNNDTAVETPEQPAVDAGQSENAPSMPAADAAEKENLDHSLVETKPKVRTRALKTASAGADKEPKENENSLVETKPKTVKKAFKIIEISEKTPKEVLPGQLKSAAESSVKEAEI